jgi:hypothetical protein
MATTPMQNNDNQKELQKMGSNPNKKKSTGSADSKSDRRAAPATGATPSVASDAKRVANMPGNAAARRRAWGKLIFGRRFVPEQLRGINVLVTA